jgi:hypothetical protein
MLSVQVTGDFAVTLPFCGRSGLCVVLWCCVVLRAVLRCCGAAVTAVLIIGLEAGLEGQPIINTGF